MPGTSTAITVQPPPLLQLPYFLGLDPHLVLFALLTLVFIAWLVFTRIMYYHWEKYAKGAPIIITVFAFHLLVSGSLFLLAGISIL